MNKIKVLGINGSPRKGNSRFLLDKAIEYAENMKDYNIETTIYSFRAKEFKPCLGCDYCGRNEGECVHNDDFAELKEMWLDSDVILYSVPVYHMSMPGQVKCFIDRLGNSFFATFDSTFEEEEETLPKLLKTIGTITQGAHIFSGQEHTITDLINHALMMQSIPVVGDMWESYIGAAGWTSNKMDKKALKELYQNNNYAAEIAVEASEKIARRSIEMAAIIQNGVKANKEKLASQEHYNVYLNMLDDK